MCFVEDAKRIVIMRKEKEKEHGHSETSEQIKGKRT